uniref:Uncharacterized protein n=1 Tax=Lepeophtheirus salmonis TaxID=72036 RepID=A0A0K2V9E5_LEPSM
MIFYSYFFFQATFHELHKCSIVLFRFRYILYHFNYWIDETKSSILSCVFFFSISFFTMSSNVLLT